MKIEITIYKGATETEPREDLFHIKVPQTPEGIVLCVKFLDLVGSENKTGANKQ